MDAIALWQRYQDWLYHHEGLGFYLDVSRIRFNDSFVEAIQPQFAKAFQDMEALEKGAIANPDEDRMVGHYWLRDPDRAPSQELKDGILETIQQIRTFTEQVHTGDLHPPGQERFTDVLCIGIGGSALGPQFVSEALSADHPPLKLHFIDNTDPAGMDRILNRLADRLPTTLVVVTSKSGGTPETRNGMLEVKHRLTQMGLDFVKQAVAVTGVDSKLDKLAKAEGWLATFPMYAWIGGRTSELSAVGLLPAALEGIDIYAMLDGAKIMDEATRIPNLKKNPAALLAMCWYYVGGGKGHEDMVLLPYKDSLYLFSRYLQQLVMESLGKEKDLDGNIVNQGIAVYGNKGSTDQHAYVQQLREGINNFFVTFIEVLKDREGESVAIDNGATSGDFLSGFLLGTRQALFENQRDSITLTVPEVTPNIVGALIALYERAVGFYASLVNINAYHQPGVEAGKNAAAVILALQNSVVEAVKSAEQPLSIAAIADKIGKPEQVETIYKILRHLSTNSRSVVLSGDAHRPSTLTAFNR